MRLLCKHNFFRIKFRNNNKKNNNDNNKKDNNNDSNFLIHDMIYHVHRIYVYGLYLCF